MASTNVKKHTLFITSTAILAALTTVMTAYILHIPVGANGGYIHLGDTIIYLAASTLPTPYACLVGIIGGGLADLLTAPAWAIPTVIIKALIVLPFTSKKATIINKRNLLAPIFSGLITIVGYYVAQGILFGWEASFFTSVGGNLVQAVGSAVCFIILGFALDRAGLKRRLINFS